MTLIRQLLSSIAGFAFGTLVAVGIFHLNTYVNAQARQLQTLREHPTEKAQIPTSVQGAGLGDPVGSCVLEDGTEVNVYLERK